LALFGLDGRGPATFRSNRVNLSLTGLNGRHPSVRFLGLGKYLVDCLALIVQVGTNTTEFFEYLTNFVRGHGIS
jgi:hypothetical protein